MGREDEVMYVSTTNRCRYGVGSIFFAFISNVVGIRECCDAATASVPFTLSIEMQLNTLNLFRAVHWHMLHP